MTPPLFEIGVDGPPSGTERCAVIGKYRARCPNSATNYIFMDTGPATVVFAVCRFCLARFVPPPEKKRTKATNQ